MSDIFDGGPAFPRDHAHDGHNGMTLRQWFAGKALQGMLADLPKTFYGLDWQQKVTASSYELADEMLRAGSEPPPVQYRELQPYDQRRIDAAERLANLVNAAKSMPGYLDLPVRQREALQQAVDDVLDPEIPF